MLALQSASDPNLTTPYPFDVLGAQTQGMIGYWLLQAMQNHLPGRQVAAIINQTLVEAADPAFADPTKFVGEMYTHDQARRLAAERGWVVKPDGDGWRRVVGSPRPQRVVETRLIRLLLESGAVVVCAGGGGVPVIRDDAGHLQGVEAVVDKDLTSAVLAEALDADVLMVLTDVAAVMRDFGTAGQAPIRRATPECPPRDRLPGRIDGPQGRRRLPLRRAHRRHRRHRHPRGRSRHPSRRSRHDRHAERRVRRHHRFATHPTASAAALGLLA